MFVGLGAAVELSVPVAGAKRSWVGALPFAFVLGKDWPRAELDSSRICVGVVLVASSEVIPSSSESWLLPSVVFSNTVFTCVGLGGAVGSEAVR